jgi:hypothetical protein
MVGMHAPWVDYALHTSCGMRHAKKHARDIVLLFALMLAVVACGEGNGATACLPEDVVRCACDDGREGFSLCDVDAGAGYGACVCDGGASPLLPEAGSGDAGAEAAAGLQFMSPCDPTNDQCPPGTSCDSFPAKGPHCSKGCKGNADCPAPSPGCNMMGVCKVP